MRELFNFDDFELSYKGYGGANEKLSIIIDGKYHMLKLSEESSF